MKKIKASEALRDEVGTTSQQAVSNRTAKLLIG
jgi:hypothetical protein